MRKICTFAAIAAATFAVGQARATEIMPSFAGAPTGWTVDRYAPDSFAASTFAGRNNVLGIGISSAQGASNRPAGQQGTFYNTQGMGYNISGAAGDSISAQLYVPKSWEDPLNGARRTDEWGVMTDSSNAVTGYPIIGFTNDNLTDSFVGFRTWDDTAGVWHDLNNAVNYGAWNTLSIKFDGTDFDYFINGALADTILAAPGTVDFSRVLMQGYNFDDTSLDLGDVPANDYTAHWANAVPEPGTIALLASGLLFLGFCSRQRSLRFSKAA